MSRPAIYKTSHKRLIIILSVLILTNCDLNRNPIFIEEKTDDFKNIKIIYAIKKEIDRSHQLYYTKFDTIKFIKINGCRYFNTEFVSYHPLFINKENELLILASQNKLFFINIQNNQKIGEVAIPNTTNSEHYIGYGVIQIYPCFWSSDYCVLVNRSIYLINLKLLEIERVIWDLGNSEKLTYIHEDAISDDGNSNTISTIESTSTIGTINNF